MLNLNESKNKFQNLFSELNLNDSKIVIFGSNPVEKCGGHHLTLRAFGRSIQLGRRWEPSLNKAINFLGLITTVFWRRLVLNGWPIRSCHQQRQSRLFIGVSSKVHIRFSNTMFKFTISKFNGYHLSITIH